MREQKLFIDGTWRAAAETTQVVDRWSGEPIGVVHRASAADAKDAVDAAEAALRRGFPVHQRAEVLERTAAYIAAHAEEFAAMITAEVGKPITASRTEVSRAVGTLGFAAEEARRLPSETVPMDATEGGVGMIGFTIAQPRGIVAAITPFNFPVNLVIHKIGPAIAAGCPVVLKPSDRTKLTAGLLTEAFEAAGIPAGYLNLVTGTPAEVVTTWQEDPRVAVVTFTGSSKVGWQLKAAAPQKMHVLELGSNTAMVVAADADVERAATDTITAALSNSGQACVSLQRVYVEAAAADQYLHLVAEKFAAVPTGDPNLDTTLVGPLVADAEVERISSWLEEATQRGAKILAGGTVEGSVLAPTLVADAAQVDRIVCEEVFGPVVSVVTVPDVDSAIAQVNDSKYGLNTAIYTASLATAMRYARDAQAGSVLVNVPPSFRADHMPYGGVKDSGQGREGVKYAVEEMTEQKLVVLKA
ncbi:aldehyde dehydrogenase family protein [Microbacterium sp. PRC9]|uniref:aldehyde dehydrogenase family protein n=1 Tax=Microbacterium sp. PRC9 TaxID=2962591 RepID=UPI0028812DEF|nr:aldehyde dehydrogenase family protein [Microbacterium sp. PRC9]MDT0143154.1 aldehyde dehydrogenase family protein [Microbacterium sp. PRC9]